jgi:hypothetical protein
MDNLGRLSRMDCGGVFLNLAPAARWTLWGNWAMGVRLKLLVATSSAVALWVGGGGVASADSLAIDFEPPAYNPGSIDNQNGWHGGENGTSPQTYGAINPAIDQSIVNNPGYEGFGQQSWRMSNAFTDGAFGDWPFSPSLQNEAGETMAWNHDTTGALVYSGGTRQNHFEVQWDFASTVPSAEQPGLQISMSPDRGDGARMSYIRLEDHADGISVFFDDYRDNKPYGSASNPGAGCGPEDAFVETAVATGLDRSEPHTVKLVMDFVDGPRNDVVKVYVDGTLRHTGTSWEDYFRYCEATLQSRTVDSMLFQARSSRGTAPATLHHGFLIDNLSYSSFSVNQCDEHNSDGDGDVQSSDGRHGHTTFHKQGCGHQDTDGVQHSDGDSGHNFQSTSVDAAQFSTAAGGRTAVITGIGTDNGLPVAFTMTVVDDDGLLPPVYSLVLSDGYTFTGTMVSGGLSVL